MSKIECRICNAPIHAVQIHLKEAHPEMSLEDYQREFPDAPLLSAFAQEHLRKKRQTQAVTVKTDLKVVDYQIRQTPFHEAFKLGESPAARGASGNPIPVTTLAPHPFQEMVPEEDEDYVYNIDLLKSGMMGMEFNIPTYIYGHAGTGKSTLAEQIAHHLNWPTIRIQHTANTEESHIVGQVLVNEQGTYFEPGPLAMAMRYGWLYLADEYDFALPQVLSVYQPVLEGKGLVIKEAPAEWRMVKPHPQFRFFATGNTNGAGDDTGLYQGTNVQNAANYSRFGICEQSLYMSADQEVSMLMGKVEMDEEDARQLVTFAKAIREAYENTDISMPIGPRELLYAARIGTHRGNYRLGIKLAYANKLPGVSRQAADELAQRYFG